MPDDETVSSAAEGGAGSETEQKGAEGTSQEGTQGQSPDTTQNVDSSESQASSQRTQPRKNYDWASQRTLEKAVKKVLSSALDERLAPLMERLNPSQQPAASQSQGEELDFNDLSGSIRKLVSNLIQREQEGLKKTLPQLKEEIIGDLNTRTTRQEARKYLISQKDIGSDASKHDEIQNIIANDKLLFHSVSEYPVEVMQEAVNRWRTSKVNPMAPAKDELTTITGGTGGGQRRGSEPSLQRIKELQDRVISSNIPPEEREKLNREIEAALMSLK